MSSDLRRVPSITHPSGGRAWGPLPGGRAPGPTRFIYACACVWGAGVEGFTSFPRQRARRTGGITPRCGGLCAPARGSNDGATGTVAMPPASGA
jgi:hypothetical protein